jgi:hypothetical protein
MECWCCYTNGVSCLTEKVGSVCQDCFDHHYKKYTDSRSTCTLYNIARIYAPFQNLGYKTPCTLCSTFKLCYNNISICKKCKI